MEEMFIKIGAWTLCRVAESLVKKVDKPDQSDPPLALICKLRTDRANKAHVDVKIWNNKNYEINVSPVKFDLEKRHNGRVKKMRLNKINVDFTTQAEGMNNREKITIPANDFQVLSFSPEALISCLEIADEASNGDYVLRPFIVVGGNEIHSSSAVSASKNV